MKLTQKQLDKILVGDAQLEAAQERCKCKGLEIKVVELQIKLMAKKLEELRSELVVCQGNESLQREANASNKKLIAKAHKIEGSWGYHPDSGEIIID